MGRRRQRPSDLDWEEFMKRAGPPRHFSWWQPDPFKPLPPASPGGLSDEPAELPQGDKKWRLNNPKKRQ